MEILILVCSCCLIHIVQQHAVYIGAVKYIEFLSYNLSDRILQVLKYAKLL